jgi:hypothetical protein
MGRSNLRLISDAPHSGRKEISAARWPVQIVTKIEERMASASGDSYWPMCVNIHGWHRDRCWLPAIKHTENDWRLAKLALTAPETRAA